VSCPRLSLILMPALLVKLLLSTAAGLVLLVATLGLADDVGKGYTEDGFKRALITYGIARGLNGVISVAQGTEVAVEPVGIGVTFTPGEILDPLNDLVERFSWIMLASGTSLGVQRVLLDVTAWVWFTALVGLALVAAALVGWWPGPGPVPPVIRRGVYRLALVLVILRFSVPLIAILGETLYSQFLEPQYAASKQKLEQTAETISTINDEARRQLPVGEDESLMASVKRAYASATGVLDVEERIEAFKRAAADVSEYAINLIVVFVLQTILFPLFSVWLVIQLVKRAVTAGFPLTPAPTER
jgi:hypothetical protein